MEKKIILFGGTFDPVHRGHTAVADFAAQYLEAEKVVFIPAVQSPHKMVAPYANDEDRLRMIKLAVAGNNRFCVSDCELRRQGPSYTLDTVKQLQAEFGPHASMYWLVGADSLAELHRWYRINEVVDRCNLCVMYRAAFDMPDFSGLVSLLGRKRVEKLRRNVIPTPLIDINSTEIRRRLSAGQDVSDMLHPAVLRYIREKNLYKAE